MWTLLLHEYGKRYFYFYFIAFDLNLFLFQFTFTVINIVDLCVKQQESCLSVYF